MRPQLLFTTLIAFLNVNTSAAMPENEPLPPLPKVAAGHITRIDAFPSAYLPPHTIDIWTPPGFEEGKRYPVLYMHDGQMLFDADITWNGQEWGVDETLSRLIRQERIPPVLVVGIFNRGTVNRHPEYFPQKPVEKLTPSFRQKLLSATRNDDYVLFANQEILSDRYLKFIVNELKPHIDQHFPVLPDRAHTFVAGSSMGGLISLYALCEYPQTFGGAACLSTHWPGIFTNEQNPIPDAFIQYLEENLPPPRNHKIYFDYGTETLDSLYEIHQQRADAVMRSRQYDASNWVTRKFPGHDHSENAWRKRFEQPVEFLLGPLLGSLE